MTCSMARGSIGVTGPGLGDVDVCFKRLRVVLRERPAPTGGALIAGALVLSRCMTAWRCGCGMNVESKRCVGTAGVSLGDISNER